MPRYIVEVPEYIELDDIDVQSVLEDALDEAGIPGNIYYDEE